MYQSKGIDESYPKMCFLLNLSHCVKSYGHFLSNFGSFYNARSPNMVMSRDPRCKFLIFFLFCPNFTFNIRKGHKISSQKAFYLRSYQQNTSRGWKHPPPSPPVPLGLRDKLNSHGQWTYRAICPS